MKRIDNIKVKAKPSFIEYIQKLMENKEDENLFWEYSSKEPRNFIRCNTLKITPEKLIEKLEKKGWKVLTPFPEFKELLEIKSNLMPGELGKTLEHQLGFYYIQEASSMMSPLALDPKEHEFIVDICASPGSKTTQICQSMGNKGLIIANDVNIPRIKALSSNLERIGCSNTIITRLDGISLCQILKKNKIFAGKILLDAPCSGEGTLRSSLKTLEMYHPNMIKIVSKLQKKLIANAIECLKSGGTLIYSTCTFEPSENETIIQFALDNFPVEIKEIKIPLKTRPGLLEWNDKQFNPEMKKCCRIYPQDNDTEGFFLAKLVKKDIK